MNEGEFDALGNYRPFKARDVAQWEGEMLTGTRLFSTLGTALWGKTSEDAQRELLRSQPGIPAGFELADFRKLLQWTGKMASAVLAIQQMRGWPPSEGFTLWEARGEIVRRAVEFFEKR
jgi:hypothetical protein